MDKIRYAPLILFGLFSTKLLILGGNLESAIVLGVLGAVASYYEFKSNDKKINDLELKINKIEQKSNEIDEVKSSFASYKMAQGYKKLV